MTATKKAPARKQGSAVTTKGKVVAEQRHVDAKQPTRKDLLEQLRELGYTGPTSYLASVLRDDLLPRVAAGCPKDAANVPAGAMAHVHPSERPAQAKRLSKGYTQALTDLLDQDDPKAWATALLAEANV